MKPNTVLMSAISLAFSCAICSASASYAAQSHFDELSQEGIDYYQKSDYKNAEKKLLEALEEAGKYMGKEERMYIALTNLAGVYKMQAKFTNAEPLYKRAMLIRQRDLGNEDSRVADAMDNLSDIYMRREKFQEAEELYKKSLAIRQHVMPEGHADIGKNMVNLAEALQELKKYDESAQYFRKGLPILEKQLGPKSLILAKGLNNYGTLYKKQNKFEQAEPLYRRSLAIYEGKSPNQPNIAMVANNLAEIYQKQGQFKDAEEYFKRSLLIREKALDAHDIGIAFALEHYSSLLKETGRLEEAAVMDERAKKIRDLYKDTEIK